MNKNDLCGCGCGGATNWNKNTRSFGRFISGHNARTGRRKEWAQLVCAACGCPYELRPHMLDMPGERKYCSAACRDQDRKDGNGPRKPAEVRTCPVCETKFTGVRKAGVTRRQYCSKECGAKAKSAALKQRRQEIVRGQQAKDRAKARDGNACLVCGFNLVVHGHHILARSKGGGDELSNLITLCPNHHAMAHAGLLPEADLFDTLARAH